MAYSFHEVGSVQVEPLRAAEAYGRLVACDSLRPTEVHINTDSDSTKLSELFTQALDSTKTFIIHLTFLVSYLNIKPVRTENR